MSLYIETIQLLNGLLMNLEFHQERLERTRLEAMGLKSHPRLAEVIRVPRRLKQGLYKCRVSYHKEIELIEYEPHIAHKVHSLKMVYSDTIDYRYKYANRTELEKLFLRREGYDDILVIKNGCVSDSFYANVVFWDGKEWKTPDTPLLPGTMRASLLRKGLIRECRITPEVLAGYQKLKLINAMNDLQMAHEISIDSIH